MKYLVIKTTKDGVLFKKNKCVDGWTRDASMCWQFSKRGAQAIADRKNASLNPYWRDKVHYNIIEVSRALPGKNSSSG